MKQPIEQHPLATARLTFREDASAPNEIKALHKSLVEHERFELREVPGAFSKHELVRRDAPDAPAIIALDEDHTRSNKLMLELGKFVVIAAAPIGTGGRLARGAKHGVLEIVDVERGVVAKTIATRADFPFMVVWESQSCIAVLIGSSIDFFGVVGGKFVRVARASAPPKRGKWGLRLWCEREVIWAVDHGNEIRCYRLDVAPAAVSE